jgi:hypothetical protein
MGKQNAIIRALRVGKSLGKVKYMIIVSLNTKGMGNPLNNNSLVRLVELQKPNILLIQETMGESWKIIGEISTILKY